jgi:hypothetical protein
MRFGEGTRHGSYEWNILLVLRNLFGLEDVRTVWEGYLLGIDKPTDIFHLCTLISVIEQIRIQSTQFKNQAMVREASES